MIGRVVSAKTPKTVSVLVERTKTHPLYKKSFVSTKKYLADDPLNTKEGDVVEILKVKPISKRKHFRVTKVLGQDIVALGEEAMKETAKQAIEEVLPEEIEKEEKVEMKNASKKTSKESDKNEKKTNNGSKEAK